jgi:hypothetical protein
MSGDYIPISRNRPLYSLEKRVRHACKPNNKAMCGNREKGCPFNSCYCLSPEDEILLTQYMKNEVYGVGDLCRVTTNLPTKGAISGMEFSSATGRLQVRPTSRMLCYDSPDYPRMCLNMTSDDSLISWQPTWELNKY